MTLKIAPKVTVVVGERVQEYLDGKSSVGR